MIKLLILDVDGTLTDGGIYYDSTGNELKKFSVKDGAGLVALQMPLQVDGVVENMSYFDHKGERLRLFGEGGGERVARTLTDELGYDVPLLGQLPLVPELRETTEGGRPAVLDENGALADSDVARSFESIARALLAHEPGRAAA